MVLFKRKVIDKVFIEKFVKYVVIWVMGAAINVFWLWFFTEVVHIYYLFSAILAFLIALLIGFYFQKYIAFKNKNNKHRKQLFLFSFFQWIGLLVDLFLLRLLVDKGWFYYIYVSLFNKWVIFIWNFLMNYFFTFYERE